MNGVSAYTGGQAKKSTGGTDPSSYPKGREDGTCHQKMDSAELSPASAYPGGIKGDKGAVTPTSLKKGEPEYALSSSELSPSSTGGGASKGTDVQGWRGNFEGNASKEKKTKYDSVPVTK